MNKRFTKEQIIQTLGKIRQGKAPKEVARQIIQREESD
jgi:hypothetical protein